MEDAQKKAIAFHAPLFLLYRICGGAEDQSAAVPKSGTLLRQRRRFPFLRGAIFYFGNYDKKDGRSCGLYR